MPKPRLKPQYEELCGNIIETMQAGLKLWRPDLTYPESYSDFKGCVMALLQMYEIKRRPIGLREQDLWAVESYATAAAAGKGGEG